VRKVGLEPTTNGLKGHYSKPVELLPHTNIKLARRVGIEPTNNELTAHRNKPTIASCEQQNYYIKLVCLLQLLVSGRKEVFSDTISRDDNIHIVPTFLVGGKRSSHLAS